jgi:RNA recognition motif-containing protein
LETFEILISSKGKPRGFGYICFKNPESFYYILENQPEIYINEQQVFYEPAKAKLEADIAPFL